MGAERKTKNENNDNKDRVMRSLLAFVFSLLTLFGGHCLNRRWDRVVLFMAVLVLLAAVFYMRLMQLITETDFEVVSLHLLDNHFNNARYTLAGLFLVSAIIAGVDARSKKIHISSQVLAIFGGVILSGAVTVAAFLLLIVSNLHTGEIPDDDTIIYSSGKLWDSYNFQNHINFGGANFRANNPPPTGTGKIIGEIVYQGVPASGVSLSLYLNGEFRVENIKTDKNGSFSIPVKPGEWVINHMQTQSWSNKPDGDYILSSGFEPPIKIPYVKRSSRNDKGLKIQVSADSPAEPLRFEIRPRIEIVWPEEGLVPEVTDVSDFAFRWKEEGNTSQYAVAFYSVTKSEMSTSYVFMLGRKIVNEDELLLESLPLIPMEGEVNTYSIHIVGFDAQGNYVSESAMYEDETKFILKGYGLVDDAFASFDLKKIQRISRNESRLDVAEKLIEEGMYNAAEELLERIESECLSEGCHFPLLIKLSVAQGKCDEAEKYMLKALALNPGQCVSACVETCPNLKELQERGLQSMSAN